MLLEYDISKRKNNCDILKSSFFSYFHKVDEEMEKRELKKLEDDAKKEEEDDKKDDDW